jgi:hypothetical protein
MMQAVLAAFFKLVSCLGYFSTLTMEVIYSWGMTGLFIATTVTTSNPTDNEMITALQFL